MSELGRVLEASSVLFRRGVQGRLVYARYFMLDLFAVLIAFALTLMIWLYVDENRGAPMALSRAQLVAYMTLAMVVNYAFQIWIDGILGARIRTGQVATDLLKPMDFQWLYFASALADLAVQVFIGTVVLLGAWAFLEQPPLLLEPLRMLAFVISLGLAVLVQYGITFVFAMSTFITHNGYGAFYIRLMSHLAFSGVFAPLLLYPERLRSIAEVLPFHCIVHTPVILGLGLAPMEDAPRLLGQQLLWAVGLLALGQFIYRRVMANLSIQGG